MTNETINQETTKPFEPIQGIIVYEKSNSYYLETHDIIHAGGKYAWQEGRPLLKEQLKELSMTLGNESFVPMDIDGIVPENLLFFKQTFYNTTIIWYQPPSRRLLQFKKDLKMANGYVKVPGLIFCSHDKDLSIIAFKGSKKPGLKTKLFKAPFHNMHDDAQVCLGNIREYKAKGILQEEMKRWERRFYNSNFTHFLDEKVVKRGTNLQLLLTSLMKSKKQFPEAQLIPSPHKTLDKFIKSIKND